MNTIEQVLPDKDFFIEQIMQSPLFAANDIINILLSYCEYQEHIQELLILKIKMFGNKIQIDPLVFDLISPDEIMYYLTEGYDKIDINKIAMLNIMRLIAEYAIFDGYELESSNEAIEYLLNIPYTGNLDCTQLHKMGAFNAVEPVEPNGTFRDVVNGYLKLNLST